MPLFRVTVGLCAGRSVSFVNSTPREVAVIDRGLDAGVVVFGKTASPHGRLARRVEAVCPVPKELAWALLLRGYEATAVREAAAARRAFRPGEYRCFLAGGPLSLKEGLCPDV